MDYEVMNVVATIINLVTNFGDAKAMVRHLWKAVELHEQHYNKIQRESASSDSSMELWKPKNQVPGIPTKESKDSYHNTIRDLA
jgi:two-component SAPR family response regulator